MTAPHVEIMRAIGEHLRAVEAVGAKLSPSQQREVAAQVRALERKFRRRGRPPVCMSAVRAYFEARQNAPATILEIVYGTGVTRGVLERLMYARHKDCFERVGVVGPIGQIAHWRLAATSENGD